MKHPVELFTHAGYADEPIEPIVEEWLRSIENRPKPVSPQTVLKYRKAVASFLRSMDEPPVLANLTKAAVDRWLSQQRLKGLSQEGILGRLAALKAFTRGHLWLEAEYTRADLLGKVKRPRTADAAKPMLNQSERDAIFAALADGGYENTRNDAFVAVLLATGLRHGAVLGVRVGDLNQTTGGLVVVEKGGVERPVTVSPGAMKKVRRWLRLRRAAEGVDALWTTAEGTPLSYWGSQSFFKRLKARSGVGRVHAHLFRHTFGQGALLKNATPGEVQELLGHRTQAMTRRYTATVAAAKAAADMPRYALL